MKGKMTKIGLQDIAVIYHSQEDEGWIAHSIHTDQVGIGNTPTNALAELIRLVDKLLALASADDSVAFLRKAPDEVIEHVKQSKPFPIEWFEVAHKKARGEWPSTDDPAETQLDSDSYTANLSESH